jgi:hypothetical protein
MSLGKIIEGWKNHLLPEERTKAFIEYVSNRRLAVCNECEHHSKNHASVRPDAHCTECGCTLAAKTKCLTCECPLKKWIAQEMPKENDVT